MYSLYSALVAMLLSILLPSLLGVSALWTVLPSVVVGVVVFLFIRRHFKAKVDALMNEAMKEMGEIQALAQRPQRGQAVMIAIDKKRARAVELMKATLAFERWQIGLALQVNAQVGMILFSQYSFLPKNEKKKLNEVVPYLENTLVTGLVAKLFQGMWYSWVCLVACYVHLNKPIERSIEVLEGAVKVAEKEGFLWAFYGWVLYNAGKKDEALDVLARGVQASPDPILKAQLNAVQNNKAPKLNDYGQTWYGLGIELPKGVAAMMKQQQMGSPHARASRGRR